MLSRMNLKLIFKIISFILIGIIIFILLSAIIVPHWTRNDGTTVVIKSFYNEPKDTIDAVFIGNSSVYKGISPMEIWKKYGITSYDFASPDQKIWLSYYFIKECFNYQKPKVIVLSVDEFFSEENISEQSLRKALDSMRYNGVKREILNDKTFNISSSEKLSYIFPILRYHSRWDKLEFDDFILEDDKDITVHKGYVITKKKKSYSTGKGSDSASIGTKVTNYLDKIIDICKENNTELVLTYIPSPVTWSEEKYNEVQNFAKSHNLKYIDLNKNNLADINWKADTEDGGWHLNLYGAMKVTDYIGRVLKDEYNLPNHKKDEEYDGWYEEEQRYDIALREL